MLRDRTVYEIPLYLSADIGLAGHRGEAQALVEADQTHLHHQLVARGDGALPAHAVHAREEEQPSAAFFVDRRGQADQPT